MSTDVAGQDASGFGADAFGDAFYPVYRRLFGEGSDFVATIDRKLTEARMPNAVELYLARALGVGLLSGLVLWLLGVGLGYGLFATGLVDIGTLIGMPVPDPTLLAVIEAVKIPLLVLVTGLFFGVIGFAAGFGTLAVIPYSRASTRKREINMLLPDAVSFMYALSVGGLNQLEILEAMAKADDTYGEVSQEFQSIVQETKYFDTDYRNAIRKQSMETPSEELSQFLTDMMSIVNSGGDMTDFLDDKKDKHMRTAKQQQELTLDTLELFGEMYMTLSLFPLLLVIILVIMGMLGEANILMLYGVVYGLIPIVGVGFVILVATVKQDEPGDGVLTLSDLDAPDPGTEDGLFDLGLVEQYAGERSIFDRIRSREGTHRTQKLLRQPHVFFRDNPLYTLALTIPGALVFGITVAVSGAAPTSWSGFIDNPVWSTFAYVYVPLYLVCLPLAVFREWNILSRRAVLANLSDNLRKLSSANDTGQTLLESAKTVSDTSSGKLADEFEKIYVDVNYGMSLKEALVRFNNRYRIPRLARTVKLIGKAQETSSQITAVLSTAAQASENQDDIDRERKSRTRMQVVIILMTYLVLLAVMAILKTQFIDTMAGLTEEAGDGAFGAGLDVEVLSLLFFHAVTLQAIISGVISGYMRDAEVLSGLKYVVVLSTIALVVWIGVS